MQLKVGALLASTGAFFFASAAVAAPVATTANFIVLGNSLSDNGNTGALLHTTAYWDGRFSNSYVWDEYTAKLLGMNLVNLAYGGATSNNAISPVVQNGITIPSLHDQVNMLLAKYPSPSQFHLENDVIQIEIGGNDIFAAIDGLLNGTLSLQTFAMEVGQSIASDIQTLVDAGYKNIDLWNLPVIQKTPMVVSNPTYSAYAGAVVATMNSAIKQLVETVAENNKAKTQGIHVFDLFSLMTAALEPQVLAALKITDSTDACYTTVNNVVNVCSNPDVHFFYDDIHPASRMHYLWGVSAAVLTRNPNAQLGVNELLSLISTFNIGQSDRNDNLIVDGITSSESAAVPPGSTATETAPTATATAVPTYSTIYVNKCH
ncbi:GDSL-like Lipase/Acylhydrolase-domain-containing protein [Coemansia spiralis]|nr:GDSL-like Lipase/Acylhydrolase-domain-containing protein [Coemansia spiralis]